MKLTQSYSLSFVEDPDYFGGESWGEVSKRFPFSAFIFLFITKNHAGGIMASIMLPG